jgi:hypothetical protein
MNLTDARVFHLLMFPLGSRFEKKQELVAWATQLLSDLREGIFCSFVALVAWIAFSFSFLLF